VCLYTDSMILFSLGIMCHSQQTLLWSKVPMFLLNTNSTNFNGIIGTAVVKYITDTDKFNYEEKSAKVLITRNAKLSSQIGLYGTNMKLVRKRSSSSAAHRQPARSLKQTKHSTPKDQVISE